MKQSKSRSSIRDRIEELAEEKYRIFVTGLTPGKSNILGVRTPILRQMAVEIVKGDWEGYLAECGHHSVQGKSLDEISLEEVMLEGMVIGQLKGDIELVLKLTAEYIPKIDCWSICDTFCAGLKITNKHKERVWDFLQPYLNSDQEYEVRFGVVMLLDYYRIQEYAARAFSHFDHIKHEGYYVKMAIAWAVSVYFIYLPEETYRYLRENELDDFTFNKALQKILESYRVDEESKLIIRSMKRKKVE
ncbi:MAG: DNA alkylation repair protein [Mobilitalea sp.]